MRAWHFVGDTLRNGDSIPKDGEKLIFPRQPVLCEQGLHASLQPFDALQFAPGNVLCLVEMGGIIIHGDNKLVGTERTIICRMNAEEMLRYFARMQALAVAHLWDIPDSVLDYLMTGDEGIRDAARAAAGDAARAAAWTAAGDAAWAAAWAAAWTAAWTAAGAAAGAAREAAWAVAREVARAMARAMAREVAGAVAREAAGAMARGAAWAVAREAAWTVAREAAWAVAREAARKDFNDLVYECFSAWMEE